MKYIITGMPCSGKTTLAGIMGKKGLYVAKGYTTRPPRDEHDKEYFFQSREDFDIKNTIYHEYNGWLYGFSTVSLWIDNIFVAGPELALKLQAFFKRENCLLIWLDPPEWTIKQRLKQRVMPGDTASARFRRDAKVFKKFEKFNAHDLRIQSFNETLRPWMGTNQ
jgi:guanylate kinase